ncbi:MAG: AAA family ATPase [Candidatus Heimdallarchaeota archaeon]
MTETEELEERETVTTLDETLDVADVGRLWKQIREEVGKTVVGMLRTIEQMFLALLCEGHVYLEGVPGLGKTYLANTFAQCLGSEFSRIQFTPDLLPADIYGTNIFDPTKGSFQLKKGPIFANVILADEINRAPPKTQSALLESMQEKQATIEGTTYPMPDPFIVISTANPIEQEGTYPLPEAQIDRFLLKTIVKYPTEKEELEIIDLKHDPKYYKARAVTSPRTIIATQDIIKRIHIEKDLQTYIRDIVFRTRNDPRILLGGSPRASIGLLVTSKARAAIHGRDYVIPDDIKYMLTSVLQHRLIMKPEAELEGITQEKIIKDITDEITCPV